MTINEAMVMQRAIRERVADLRSVRNTNLTSTRRWDLFDNGKEKERIEITAHYDPKVVDAKITELELFLFKIDTAIKRANAKAEVVGISEADVNKLLEPIK